MHFKAPKVKKAIENSGRTRKWLAKQLGIKGTTFSLYVNGHQKPGRETAATLAKLLGVELHEIAS